MIWEQYKYVSNIFRMRFPEFYLLNDIDKGLRYSRIMKIIESVCKNELSKISKDDCSDSELENIVYKSLDEQLDNYFSKDLRTSINEKFAYIYSDKFISMYVGSCSYDLIRYMAGQILIILHDKNVTLNDDKITLHYSELYIRLTNKIKEKVKNVFGKQIEFGDLKKIDYDQLIDNVVSSLMLNFDNRYLRILEKTELDKDLDEKELDNKILNLIRYEINRVNVKQEIDNSSKEQYISYEQVSYNYILEYMLLKYASVLDLDERKKCADFVYKRLVSEHCDVSDIICGIHDSRIEDLSNFWLNSHKVKIDSVEVEYKPVTKKNHKAVIALLLVATLAIGGVSTAAYNDSRNKKIESVVSQLMLDDGFSLGNKATLVYDYSSNSKKVLETYNKRVDLLPNERCDYIAFSECYLQLDTAVGTKLVIMDRLLSSLIHEASLGTSNSEFYYGIVGNRCYLELMYKSLKYMGYEEIDQIQYKTLLNRYMEIKREYPNEKDPVSKMSIDEKNLIGKIEKEYIKLSKDKLYDIAFLPIYGDSMSVDRGGRL